MNMSDRPDVELAIKQAKNLLNHKNSVVKGMALALTELGGYIKSLEVPRIGLEMSRDDYIKLSNYLDFLEEYHGRQKKNTVTRFRGKFADVYVVSGRPEGMRDKLREITEPFVEK